MASKITGVTTESARYQIPLNKTDLSALSGLSSDHKLRQLNANLFAFTLHMSALAIFAHRATQDETVVIEAPLLGRFAEKWMHVAGNFIEMARFEIPIHPSDSILDVYLVCRTTIFNVMKQAQPGMTQLLKPGPVHAVLNYITAQSTQQNAPGTHLQWHHTGHSDTHHPLRLHVADWNVAGMPTLEMDINRAFFTNDGEHSDLSNRAVQHLLGCYRAMLESRETAISAIPLIQADERWMFTKADKAAALDVTVVEQISQRSAACAGMMAVSDGTETLSYTELESLVVTISTNLAALGIGRGDRVAVHLPRCLQLPAILLGILRCGAAYIPIDMNQPELRVESILNDARPAAIISVTEQKNASTSGILHLPLKQLLAQITQATDIDWPAADDPAYIIYTSGSTGTPKGVVVSHSALQSYSSWAAEFYADNMSAHLGLVMPLFTSIGFDLTVSSIYLPLLTAGHIRVFAQSSMADAVSILDVIRDRTINTVKLTPAHLSLLLEQDLSDTRIQQLIVGGEDLKADLAQRADRAFAQDITIINEYGPTEATVGCIVRRWRSDDSAQGSVPIGLPISGMEAYLLNESQNPQLEGLSGELYIGGPSLANGYWQDDALTAASFIDNPWRAGTKLYRTGDIAKVSQGELVYLGRNDNQLKINGYRIDTTEIESALLTHSDVSDCVVLATDNQQISADDSQQRYCIECGLSSLHPDANLDSNGVCELCIQYEPNRSRIDAYFKTSNQLQQLIDRIKSQSSGEYDALVLLSGGKDSTYTLCKLVDMGLNVCALSLDNGFISDQAKANIKVVCDALQVKHHYATTPAMNQIFVDSLDRYSNVCHGCFKTIYTLALQFAAEQSIDYIFTGLSRGQLFETRLNNELFSAAGVSEPAIDNMVKAARLQYHAVVDAPNTLLNVTQVNDGTLIDKIEIIDFYRYYHVEMSEMLAYLKSRVGWVRPPDTGRSTNCLINDVGIHVHKLERGYHNYSLPYSWDVRLGHKRREEALDELDDDINLEHVESILSEIGYSPKEPPSTRCYLSAHYTANKELSRSTIEQWLKDRLPDYMLPQQYTQLDAMPMTPNGKIDRAQITARSISFSPPRTHNGRAPSSREETLLADIWRAHVQASDISAEDNFFELGGDSLSAIRCVMQLRKMGYELEPADLFRTPRLAQFAQLLGSKTNNRLQQTTTTTPEKFASLDSKQKNRLAALLKKNSNTQP